MVWWTSRLNACEMGSVFNPFDEISCSPYGTGDDQRTRRRSNDPWRAILQERAVRLSGPGHHQSHQGTHTGHAASSPVPTPRGNILPPSEDVGFVFTVCQTCCLNQLQTAF